MLACRNTVLVFKWLVKKPRRYEQQQQQQMGGGSCEQQQQLGGSCSEQQQQQHDHHGVHREAGPGSWKMRHLVSVTLTTGTVLTSTGTYCGALEIDFWRFSSRTCLLVTDTVLSSVVEPDPYSGAVVPYSEFGSGPTHVKIGHNRGKRCKM